MKEKIVGGLLGLMFVIFGLNYFFNFLPNPPMAEGSPAAAFMGAIYSTGFLGFVKVLEIIGGVLVAIPNLRRLGMLILGPIVVNILAFNIYLAPGGWTQPPVIIAVALSAYLLWSERHAFHALINGVREIGHK
ncbi:MAG: hypothetical protein SynsKO_45610 [Synoicihabitans sp.]